MRSIDGRPSLGTSAAITTVVVLIGCGANQPPMVGSPTPPTRVSNSPARVPEASKAKPAARAAGSGHSPAPAAPATSTTPSLAQQRPAKAACPDDMVHVRHEYCDQMQRRCLKTEYDKSNRITICHEFAEGENECASERRSVNVCVDRFEYPNQKGGHPPVMVDFFDAERACQAEGKRLCLESEWVSACEGPEEKPFPYGYRRSSEQCNIDNRWLEPNLGRVYSKRQDIRDKELARLDQSVPSGSKPGCVSDFGVFDLTGNFDEWVRLDEPRPKARSKMAGLKGGAWGHVRNACRPVTTSHAPEFTYYFISFRCCKDIADAASDSQEGSATNSTAPTKQAPGN